jgi:hypothetical protein
MKSQGREEKTRKIRNMKAGNKQKRKSKQSNKNQIRESIRNKMTNENHNMKPQGRKGIIRKIIRGKTRRKDI